MEILVDAEAKFPREAAIPYNLACYYCQLGEMEKAKRYLKEAFEIDLNWRTAALEDEDLRPFGIPSSFAEMGSGGVVYGETLHEN